MKLISFIQDFTKENTYSVLTEVSTKKFRDMLINNKWTNITPNEIGQREFITRTAKARLIGKRLEKDIVLGAVLPPIVMGFVTSEAEKLTKEHAIDLIQRNYQNIFILDGVQRCTNLIRQDKDIKDSTLRIEWWITKKIDAALDRMLILNFAQNPWDIKQQSKAIALLFKKADPQFQKFSEKFEDELVKEPNRFLECLFSFQKRVPDVYIKDEVSSVFLQENETKPRKDLLEPFGVVYQIATLWSAYLPAEHSVRVGICLAMADMIEQDKNFSIEKILTWSQKNVETLGEILDEKNGQNYLDYATLQSKYKEIKSAIGRTSRVMFRIAFHEIFNNILISKDIWENPTTSDTMKANIQTLFGEIWEKAYNQV